MYLNGSGHLLTPKKLAEYRSGWRNYKKEEERQLAQRYRLANDKVRQVATHLKQTYNCKVILFGSLLREENFMEHSDIDIAVSGLNSQVNFWKLYSEVMDILAPFDFDLVELENIETEVKEYIQKGGVEL